MIQRSRNVLTRLSAASCTRRNEALGSARKFERPASSMMRAVTSWTGFWAVQIPGMRTPSSRASSCSPGTNRSATRCTPYRGSSSSGHPDESGFDKRRRTATGDSATLNGRRANACRRTAPRRAVGMMPENQFGCSRAGLHRSSIGLPGEDMGLWQAWHSICQNSNQARRTTDGAWAVRCRVRQVAQTWIGARSARSEQTDGRSG